MSWRLLRDFRYSELCQGIVAVLSDLMKGHFQAASRQILIHILGGCFLSKEVVSAHKTLKSVEMEIIGKYRIV